MQKIRNPQREFSAEIRKAERVAAGHKCRICGKPNSNVKGGEWLQHAHIYTLSMNSHWERKGTDHRRWKDDSYVSSVDNCVVLCKTHHGKIDSPLGLQKVTIQYLESLKNLDKCTALIGPLEGEWHRCNIKAKYRCNQHAKGGNEETLEVRSGGYKQSGHEKTFGKEISKEGCYIKREESRKKEKEQCCNIM